MLVSDMLISGLETENSSDLKLPDHISGVDKTFPKGSGFVPLRLKRKLFIINDNLAVGLSGSFLHMRSFLDDLRERNRVHRLVTSEDMHQFIDEYVRSPHGAITLKEITALALLQERHGCNYFVLGDKARESCSTTDTKGFGNVLSIGSGQQSVLDEVARIDKYNFIQPNTHGMKVDRFHAALAKVLALLSQLNKLDSLTSKYLLEYWGGGYEVIYYNGKKFQFLDDYSSVNWLFDISQNKPQFVPLSLIKYKREENYSVFFCNQNGEFHIFAGSDISESCKRTLSFDVRNVSFNSPIMNNLILVTDGCKIQNIYNFYGMRSVDQPGIVFTEVDDKANLTILIQSGVQSELERYILKHQDHLSRALN
ncbi:hypothetical protein [Pseudovibrio sp. Ad13]|uniref:hypothetical protein n=1 Tax=Pseudovibrio sp. Ad13 TaxID=989396 RepID=UPI00128FFFAF|nr:hypothetical protein [Pseudovibrio sp. Ad13]